MPKIAKEKTDKLNNEKNKNNIANKVISEIVEKATSKTSKSNLVQKTVETKKVTKSSKSNPTEKSSKSDKSVKATKSVSKTSKSTNKKSTTSSRKSKSNLLSTITTEYYDLPFRYNQTVVRILTQTPNTLFIYWDISDVDRNEYIQKYGNDFFYNTRPYLIITNETMNYTFEVAVDDFANSWYLHINDANCKYKVELWRKFIVNSNHSNTNINDEENSFSKEPYYINDYIYITSSNKIDAPNDHILFDNLGNHVFFKDVKSNITKIKDTTTLSFIQKNGKIYNIYDLYKELYDEELISNSKDVTTFGINSSSTFK